METIREPLKLISLLCICIITLLSCNKDETKETDTLLMQAKIGGTLRICKAVNLRPLPNPYNDPYNGIFGATLEDPNFWIVLNFPISEGLGTYQFGGESNESSAWVEIIFDDLFDPNNRSYRAESGSVTVTESTGNSYKGNFSFSTVEIHDGELLSVTEGIFQIEY